MNEVLSSELFEAFASASDNIYIYVSDMKTGVTRWSKEAVDYFGLPSEYIEDTTTMWVEHIHPEDRSIFIEDISKVLNGTSRKHNCQYRARNRYGDYNWVECKGSVIYGEDGEPDLFAGLMTRLDNRNKYDPITHMLTGYELMREDFNDAGALMNVGIDNFRKINSQYGLSYGNRVLVYLAECLKAHANGALVYRFQGDEFLIYGKGMNAEQFTFIFEKVKQECLTPIKEEHLVGFSITGSIVEFGADEGTVKVLAKSELCFNYAKENRGSFVTVYSADIEKSVNRKKLISESLLESIKEDFKGFRLVYQPIIANTGDSVVGCEALLRWKSDREDIGNCYPDEFISILESNGGMKDVGYFVMREAIRQASIWQKNFKEFNVSFNVSYVQLEDAEFVPDIVRTIEKYGANPQRIIVELTESILNVDTVKVKKSFELLRKHGILIALDDFGTGNSSFWMLHNIDVDVLKLDQSFIRGLEGTIGIDYAIVKSIGIMCDHIGCKTVAEGVETKEIWTMLSEFGFTGLQGYLFSKPIEVADFEEFLLEYNMGKNCS